MDLVSPGSNRCRGVTDSVYSYFELCQTKKKGFGQSKPVLTSTTRKLGRLFDLVTISLARLAAVDLPLCCV